MSLKLCEADPTHFSTIRYQYLTACESLLENRNLERFPEINQKDLDNFRSGCSQSTFVCRYIHCVFSTDGFESASRREKHESQHQRRFRCAYFNCFSFELGFGSRSQLKKHNEQYHPIAVQGPRLTDDLANHPTKLSAPVAHETAGYQPLLQQQFTAHNSTLDTHRQDQQDPADSAYETWTQGPSQMDPCGRYEQNPTDSACIAETQEMTGLYATATMYSASVTPSLLPLRDKHFIADLAKDLFKTIKSRVSERTTLERISKMLPDLLRSFALKIGYKAQTSMQRDIMCFIHKYRG